MSSRLFGSLVIPFFLASFAHRSFADERTIPVHVKRSVPERLRLANFKAEDDHDVPYDGSRCNGVTIERIDWALTIDPNQPSSLMVFETEATVRRDSDEAVTVPILTIFQAATSGKTEVSNRLSNSASGREWTRKGAILLEGLSAAELTDPKFWKNVTLTCSAMSPLTPVAVPEGVNYKRAETTELQAVATRFERALKSEDRFATLPLYPNMVIVGPELWSKLSKDEEAAAVKSPRMAFIAIDRPTEMRAAYRFKDAERIAMGHALNREFNGVSFRLRAATPNELRAIWTVIGWDLTEPVFVLDSGTRRLFLDLTFGFIEEIPESVQ